MSAWRVEIIRTWVLWTGNPQTDVKLWAFLFLGVAVLVIAMEKAAKALNATNAGTGRAAASGLGGLLLVTALTVASQIYLAPHIEVPLLRKLLPLVAPLLACLAVAAPLCSIVHRFNYMSGLIAVAVSIVAAAVVVLLVGGAIEMLQYGEKEVQRTKGRTEDLNRIL